MQELRMGARKFVARFWERIREWCGDSSYEQYQRAMERKREPLLLNARQFYVEQLERKYSRPHRCC